jgi:hypothetical protein
MGKGWLPVNKREIEDTAKHHKSLKPTTLTHRIPKSNQPAFGVVI